VTSHAGLLVLFAFFVAVVFAVIAHDDPRQQIAFGARVFGGFVAAGLVLGWLMYPLPL
jgi:prepilin signal peptidase PulO-like enzyme (type II secretory pathway)